MVDLDDEETASELRARAPNVSSPAPTNKYWSTPRSTASRNAVSANRLRTVAVTLVLAGMG